MAFSRQLEVQTVLKMITMYCHKMHDGGKGQLCLECTDLFNYAERRIHRCPYGDDKPVCSKCKVHCYNPEMREKIKTVMQYSGPKMMLNSPILSLRYMYRKAFKSDQPLPPGKSKKNP